MRVATCQYSSRREGFELRFEKRGGCVSTSQYRVGKTEPMLGNHEIAVFYCEKPYAELIKGVCELAQLRKEEPLSNYDDARQMEILKRAEEKKLDIRTVYHRAKNELKVFFYERAQAVR